MNEEVIGEIVFYLLPRGMTKGLKKQKIIVIKKGNKYLSRWYFNHKNKEYEKPWVKELYEDILFLSITYIISNTIPKNVWDEALRRACIEEL